MTFAAWSALDPAAAAREVHRRVQERLSPAQQRAALATLTGEEELATALAAGQGALRGIPFFIKDLFDVVGLPTKAGSTFLPAVRAARGTSAFVTACTSLGAAAAGKAHLHEFAYGVTGENPHYGDCENPAHPGRTTGGSSSGSAALVAAGIVPLALGTDTGGSVRVPAAFCGLHGFRLTPKHPWIQDAFPLSPTCDTAGWFTAGASDMAASHATLIGSRPLDRTPRGYYLPYGETDPQVAQACGTATAAWAPPAPPDLARALVHHLRPSAEAYHTIVATDAWEIHRNWAEANRSSYDPAVWQRLTRAHSITAAEQESARHVVAQIRSTWAEYFRDHDFLVLPAVPCAALTKADCTLGNRGRIIGLNAPASLGGLPVLTLPIPLADGLTAGVQVVLPDPCSPVVPWLLGLR